MSRHAIILLAVSVVVLAVWGARMMGFIGPPRCELLAGEDQFLRTLNFGPMDREALHEWVSTTYGIPRSEIEGSRISGLPNDIIAADWTDGTSDYSATRDEDGLRSVNVWFDRDQPRVQELFDCFGPPSHYRAIYVPMMHRNELLIDLWYPAGGVVAQFYEAASLLQDQPPRASGRSVLRNVTFTRSRDPEEIVTIAPIFPRHSLNAYPLKPWPGSFEAIEIEIDPAILDD